MRSLRRFRLSCKFRAHCNYGARLPSREWNGLLINHPRLSLSSYGSHFIECLAKEGVTHLCFLRIKPTSVILIRSRSLCKEFVDQVCTFSCFDNIINSFDMPFNYFPVSILIFPPKIPRSSPVRKDPFPLTLKFSVGVNLQVNLRPHFIHFRAGFLFCDLRPAKYRPQMFPFHPANPPDSILRTFLGHANVFKHCDNVYFRTKLL